MADISQNSVEKLPCSRSIQNLLDNGLSESAPGAREIAIELSREIRRAGLEAKVTQENIDATTVETLKEEIRQIERDLISKRSETQFADIVDYLSRLGLVFTVAPSEKRISVKWTAAAIGKPFTLMINSKDNEMLKVDSHNLWIVGDESKRRAFGKKILSIINKLNWNLEMLKLLYDPEDGEVHLSLRIPHAHAAIPYEEFARQFVTMVNAGESVWKVLRKELK